MQTFKASLKASRRLQRRDNWVCIDHDAAAGGRSGVVLVSLNVNARDNRAPPAPGGAGHVTRQVAALPRCGSTIVIYRPWKLKQLPNKAFDPHTTRQRLKLTAVTRAFLCFYIG